jgi:hypothetical protein
VELQLVEQLFGMVVAMLNLLTALMPAMAD